jgi:hypothetical protein
MNTLMKYAKGTLCLVLFLWLTACATVEDVQRASSLIRLDNEMSSVLKDPVLTASDTGKAMLAVIASNAKTQAKISKNKNDGIAFYRVAATARWQQKDADSMNDLAEIINDGLLLCSELDDEKPDRDCFMLKLVLPFQALEVNAYDFSNQLATIDFSDVVATENEVITLNDIYNSLTNIYSLLNRVLNIDKKDLAMLKEQASLKSYFCTESKNVFDFYRTQWGPVNAKTTEFVSYRPSASVQVLFSRDKLALLNPQTLKDKYDSTFSMCAGGY